ncbi:MAG: PEP-CTERM sorting domain-containing protein, partial [Verrucomicrobiota bacterium]
YIGALAQAETGNEFFQLTLFLAEDAAGTNTNLSGGGRVNTGRLSFNASSDSSFSTFSQNFDITSLVSEGATHLRAVELKYRVESATVTAIQTAYIDDVSIEAVVSIPEPSTYALISIATLTFFVLRRKKR